MQAEMRSAMVCGHCSGTTAGCSRPRVAKPPVTISHSTTPKEKMSLCKARCPRYQRTVKNPRQQEAC